MIRIRKAVAGALVVLTGAIAITASEPEPEPAEATTINNWSWLAALINYLYTNDVIYIETSDLNWMTGLSHAITGGCCEAPYDYSSARSRYAWLNWTNDGCSVMADRLFYYDFRKPCIRHDFSYRNWKYIESLRRSWNLSDPDAWSEAKRAQVDYVFYIEMLNSCEGRWLLERGACQREAEIWYNFVRAFGS